MRGEDGAGPAPAPLHAWMAVSRINCNPGQVKCVAVSWDSDLFDRRQQRHCPLCVKNRSDCGHCYPVHGLFVVATQGTSTRFLRTAKKCFYLKKFNPC